MSDVSQNHRKKICHMTSAHAREDVRIFQKQCRSLALSGFEVSLIVADGKGDKIIEGVSIFDVGSHKGRLDRMYNTTKRVFKKARELDADLYHFHDPELILVGLRLKRRNKCVVYDVHEDLPRDIMSKEWIPAIFRRFISWGVEFFENLAAKKVSAIVTSTPFIRDRFAKIAKNCVDINNFPIIEELAISEINWADKTETVCYVGGITKSRGIEEIVQSVGACQEEVGLALAGTFLHNGFREEIIKLKGWNKVEEHGWLNRIEIQSVLNNSKMGLVTLHPIINYIDALPVKMFEYMAAGIPVIASNFPLWKDIVDDAECGICVDPLNIPEITAAIDYLLSHSKEAEKMGRKGRAAILKKYNWQNETVKLITLYRNILQIK